jgi:hypothetical protein
MRSALLLVIGSVAGTLALSEPSRVQDSPLPSGQGLGAEIAWGSSLSSHPEVIFSEDFESSHYTKSWDEVRDQSKDVLSRVRLEDSEATFGHSLKVTARLGRNTGGGLTKWFASSERLFVRFYTRFDEKCDYVHHFVTLRANKGLIGKDRWSGFGGAGLLPNGKDRFSTGWSPGGTGAGGRHRDSGTSIPTGTKWSQAQTESIGAIKYQEGRMDLPGVHAPTQHSWGSEW